jgi:hypothetical protein
VSSRLPYPTNPSGDGETGDVSIINMASDNFNELPTILSNTDAAHSTTSLAPSLCSRWAADIDARLAADSNEYAGVEWSRPSLRGYARSRSSALKTSWRWDYGWRIDNKCSAPKKSKGDEARRARSAVRSGREGELQIRRTQELHPGQTK